VVQTNSLVIDNVDAVENVVVHDIDDNGGKETTEKLPW